MINTTDEKLITLSAAAKSLPRAIHQSTAWRWCIRGLYGVKLDYVRVGARIYTSSEAVKRFTKNLADLDPHMKP